MKNFIIFTVFSLLVAVFIVSCSSGNPASPDSINNYSNVNSLPVIVTDLNSENYIQAGMGSLGLFNLHLDPENLTGEMISLRQNALTDVLEIVDITNFLQLAPCYNCVKLKSFSLNDAGNLVVSIGIKHPFDPGDPFKPVTGRNRGDLHVFNVEGIVISNSTASSFSNLGENVADSYLVNADGYSGYLDSVIDLIYPTDATLHPYILHFDDYSSGNFDSANPMGFESVTNPPPSGNLVMPMGSDYDYKDYVFDLSDGEVDFIFAVGCTYAVSSATKSQRFAPEFRVPQHNKKAASEVWVEIVENNLIAGDVDSSATIRVSVVDISHGVPTGDDLNEMFSNSSIGVILTEIPGITENSVSFSTDPISGTGHNPSDPLIFEGTILNSLAAGEGIYFGLVKVTDSYLPGLNTSPLLNSMEGIERVDPLLNPLVGLFMISEFATYQVFSIDITTSSQITVTRPDGGEEWLVGSDEEITWTSEGFGGTVFIEYSKDNFLSDINLIASDADNNGSYLWQNIPEDPSDTVRVRVSSTNNPSINDTSDNDFKIFMIHIGWAQHWGPNAFTGGKGVAVDYEGNSYVTGKFMGNIDFNPDPNENDYHTSNGGYDVYLIKYNRNGTFQWARTWGGSGWEYNRGLAVDKDGYIYVPGYFDGTVDFNPDPIDVEIRSSYGSSDSFLSKFDTNGNFIWVRTWGGGNADDAYGAEADEFGNVYVTGHFWGIVDFDPSSGTDYRTSNGNYDAYLSKFDSNGNFLWVRTWGGTLWDYGHDITVDNFGDVYNVGWYGGTVDFDTGTGNDFRTSDGDCGIYLTKFSPNGDYIWVRTWGGSSRQNYDFGTGVSSDFNSNIYVAGRFLGTVDFDPGTQVDEHTSYGDVDAFLTSFNHSGDFRWARTWGSASDDYARGVACDFYGNVFVGGHFQLTIDFNPDPGFSEIRTARMRDVYLSKFDTDGNFIWVRAFGGQSNDRTGMVDVDRFGNVFFTGIFQGTGDLAPSHPPCNEDILIRSSSGECDAFLVKYLPDGCWNED